MSDTNGQREIPIGGSGLYDKLLVIGSDSDFSDFLMDYSIEMASRMNYAIVAVNLRMVQGRRRRFLETKAGETERGEMKKRSEEGAKRFAAQAREAGIGFTQLFRIGDLDEVVRNVYDERGDIDLVLLEPDYLNVDQSDHFTIPAFSLTPHNL